MVHRRILAAGTALLVSALCISAPVPAAADTGFPSATVHGKIHWDIDWDEVHSSVRLTEDQKKQLHQTVEQAYQQALMPRAKITAKQAADAARKVEPKTAVTGVKLHSVHGNVVYMVHGVRDGERVLVVVDAGNGNVLTHKAAKSDASRGDD
ncbi:MAG: PepSY domain-containing protein [Kyrpidia sp.]|nr:PepSY domain-containing protein [Kyrpidia sp.]